MWQVQRSNAAAHNQSAFSFLFELRKLLRRPRRTTLNSRRVWEWVELSHGLNWLTNWLLLGQLTVWLPDSLTVWPTVWPVWLLNSRCCASIVKPSSQVSYTWALQLPTQVAFVGKQNKPSGAIFQNLAIGNWQVESSAINFSQRTSKVKCRNQMLNGLFEICFLQIIPYIYICQCVCVYYSVPFLLLIFVCLPFEL